jgi:hypothetical protein
MDKTVRKYTSFNGMKADARAVYAALAEFGAPLEGMTAADFAESRSFFRMEPSAWGVNQLPWTFLRKFPALICAAGGGMARMNRRPSAS